MTRRTLRAIAFATLVGLAACAAQGEENETAGTDRSGRGDCFNVSAVAGFNAVDDDTVKITSGAREFELDIRGPGCNQVQWTENIAIEGRPSPWICTDDGPNQGQIHFSDSVVGQPRTCFIQEVRRIERAPTQTGS